MKVNRLCFLISTIAISGVMSASAITPLVSPATCTEIVAVWTGPTGNLPSPSVSHVCGANIPGSDSYSDSTVSIQQTAHAQTNSSTITTAEAFSQVAELGTQSTGGGATPSNETGASFQYYVEFFTPNNANVSIPASVVNFDSSGLLTTTQGGVASYSVTFGNYPGQWVLGQQTVSNGGTAIIDMRDSFGLGDTQNDFLSTNIPYVVTIEVDASASGHQTTGYEYQLSQARASIDPTITIAPGFQQEFFVAFSPNLTDVPEPATLVVSSFGIALLYLIHRIASSREKAGRP